MARQSFTRESALQYLAGRTDLSFKKPLSEYKTPYLKRLASEYKRAEQEGREPPERKEVRGKGKERIRYYEATQYFAESWEVGNKRYPVKFEELSQLLAKVGEHNFYNVLIFGIPKNYGVGWTEWEKPKKKGLNSEPKPDWRTYRIDKRSLLNSLELAKGNVLDFAEWVSGQEWIKVYAIAMRAGPDNPYGKSARRKKGT